MNENIKSVPGKLPEENRHEMSELMKMLVDALHNREDMVKINEFGHFLKDKYPDCINYRLYHFIIGSTPRGECPYYDFPDNDSVEKFIRSL